MCVCVSVCIYQTNNVVPEDKEGSDESTAEVHVMSCARYRLGGEVLKWCEGQCKDQKRDSAELGGLLKRQEKEEELENIFKELKDIHADKHSLPQLRLWSRMVSAGLHIDMETPPDVPAFHSSAKKRISRGCYMYHWCCC